MPINILMPALSPTMEKGNLAKWHVKEGDTVKSGDIIAEIETDKATMEYEAVDEGKIGKILVPEGTSDVDVNQPIAVLLEEGEEAGAAEEAPKASAKNEAKVEAKPAEDKAASEASKAEKAPAEPKQAEAPKASEKGYGMAAPGAGGAEAAKPATNGASGERVFSSPLARRIAKEKGIDLSAIAGSGPHGRIVQRDVEGAKAGVAGAPGVSTRAGGAGAAAPVQAPSDSQIKGLFEEGSYEEVPNDGMRKTIARRLLESKLTIPHFYLSLDCEIDALLSLRAQVNAVAPKDGPGAYKLSVNDFVIKAMAMALQKVPAANATWTEAATLRHKHSDVGVAVAIEGGLFTPVIRKAETKTLSVISAEMKDYAARARSKKLKPAEYLGGTTSVSNLGMYGIREFAAVINPPHSTILAVGAGEKRAIVKDDAVKVATVMTATLSCDHRAVDGALGAELLSAFKAFIESPMSMLV